jgi:hypothetical protein
MDLRLVYSQNDTIHCAAFSLIIRNKALQRNYPGGLAGFLRRFPSRSNRHITVFSDSGLNFEMVGNDLWANGLTYGQDFVLVDAADYDWALLINPDVQANAHRLDLGVAWLRGRYADRQIHVWYHPEAPPDSDAPPATRRAFSH